MSKGFIVVYTDWRGVRDTFFCHASNEIGARAFARWTLGELIDIQNVEIF